jgi:hypothetical protein
MKEKICIVLFFISGALIYQILKLLCECSLTEGYGEFGRVSLGKCCPKGYKYSKTMKKCVHICDACDPSIYNKLTLKKEQYPGDSQPQLHAYFDCDEHDASTVHDFDSINRRYTKDDLLDQNNYGGWNMNSDFFTAGVPSADGSNGSEDSTSGVQGAEEGGDETWGSITGEYSGASGPAGAAWNDANEGVTIFPFEGLPEETYYTNQEDCDRDYDRSEDEGMNVVKPDGNCRGHWKLDFENPIITYLKDDENRILTAPFVITETKPDGLTITTEEYHQQNATNIRENILDGMDEQAPVYQYYNRFLDMYQSNDEDERRNERDENDRALKLHRNDFCVELDENIDFFEGEDIRNQNIVGNITYNNLCPSESEILSTDSNIYLSNNNWNILCESDMNVVDDSPFRPNEEDGNRLCEYENGGGEDNSGHKYLCHNTDRTELDTSKTFCST